MTEPTDFEDAADLAIETLQKYRGKKFDVVTNGLRQAMDHPYARVLTRDKRK